MTWILPYYVRINLKLFSCISILIKLIKFLFIKVTIEKDLSNGNMDRFSRHLLSSEGNKSIAVGWCDKENLFF